MIRNSLNTRVLSKIQLIYTNNGKITILVIVRSEGKLTAFFKDEGILAESKLYDAAGLLKLTRTSYYPFIEEKNKDGVDVVVMFTEKDCTPCK